MHIRNIIANAVVAALQANPLDGVDVNDRPKASFINTDGTRNDSLVVQCLSEDVVRGGTFSVMGYDQVDANLLVTISVNRDAEVSELVRFNDVAAHVESVVESGGIFSTLSDVRESAYVRTYIEDELPEGSTGNVLVGNVHYVVSYLREQSE